MKRKRHPYHVLYWLHGQLVERKFDGRGMRLCHHVALWVVRKGLDWVERNDVRVR